MRQQTAIEPITDASDPDLKRPAPSALRVYWIIKGQFGLKWKHVGWLMPEVS